MLVDKINFPTTWGGSFGNIVSKIEKDRLSNLMTLRQFLYNHFMGTYFNLVSLNFKLGIFSKFSQSIKVVFSGFIFCKIDCRYRFMVPPPTDSWYPHLPIMVTPPSGASCFA
jgi:hypothetical protein